MAASDVFDRVREVYREQGVGGGRVGFGEKPALLIIDLQHIYTRGRRGTGLEPVERTAELIAVSRAQRVPVIYTYVGYDPDHVDTGTWGIKCPGLREDVRGSQACEIDPLVAPNAGELIIEKRAPSAFFGTGLAEHLRAAGVDTVIAAGTSTSGCVRATVVEGVSHGFRMIVPVECVSDRSEPSHIAALFDIDSKYGDVVPMSEVLLHLEARVD